MKKANIIASLIGMCLASAAFGYTFTFKKFKNVPVGPEFFPRALAVALFICCFVLFVQNLILLCKNREEEKKAPTLNPMDKGVQKALLGLAIIVAYVILWNFAGFPVITPFAIFAMICLLGKKTYVLNAVIALAFTFLIFMVFKFLLGITMPLGFIENLI